MEIKPDSKHPAKAGGPAKSAVPAQTAKASHIAQPYISRTSFEGKEFDADWMKTMKPNSTAGKVSRLLVPQGYGQHAHFGPGRVTVIKSRG